MKGIVSFDMDMTLLNHADYKIPDSAIKALDLLRKNYYIVIATGRDMDAKFSEGLADEVKPDAIIHLNGNKITIGSELIYEHCMKRELVEELLQFAEGKDYAIGMNKDNTALLDAVNAALEELKADGTLQSIVDKYITAE